MTLGRLVLAWLPVTLLFALVPLVRSALASRLLLTPGTPGSDPAPTSHMTPGASPGMARRWVPRDVSWRAAEAGVLTLFASLWFDSLGHGGWFLLFLLVGLLAGFAARLPHLADDALERRRPRIVDGLLDTARYVVAGALLAWRLG